MPGRLSGSDRRFFLTSGGDAGCLEKYTGKKTKNQAEKAKNLGFAAKMRKKTGYSSK